jgi:hypothetical protein
VSLLLASYKLSSKDEKGDLLADPDTILNGEFEFI